MTLRVLLFASYADALGRDALDVALPEGATVGELVSRIGAMPGGNRLPPRPLVAVNHGYAEYAQALRAGDEVTTLHILREADHAVERMIELTRRDERAPPALSADVALVDQLGHRLADGHRADAEVAREIGLRGDGVAGLERAGRDQRRHALVKLDVDGDGAVLFDVQREIVQRHRRNTFATTLVL